MKVSIKVVGVLVLLAFLLGVGVTTLVFKLAPDSPERAKPDVRQIADRNANEHKEQDELPPAKESGSPAGDAGTMNGKPKDQQPILPDKPKDTPAPGDPATVPVKDAAKDVPNEPAEKPTAPLPADAIGSELGKPMDLTATISGTVVDHQGNPVPGADIVSDVIERAGTTTRAGSAGKFATTDSGGNFTGVVKTRVGDKAAVTLALRAKAEGHADSRHVQVKAKPGDEKAGVRISMRACGSVRGRVVTAADAGVPGAKVSLESRDQEEGVIRDEAGNTVSFGGGHSATTDANGDYVVEDAPEGSYTLQLAAPGYKESSGPRSADVQAGAATPVENFVVVPATSLRVKLAREDGKPVLGWAIFEITNSEGEIVKQLSTAVGADGTAIVNNPPVGAFNVTVKVSGCAPTPKSWQTFIQDQQTDMGTLTLGPTKGTQESKAVMAR